MNNQPLQQHYADLIDKQSGDSLLQLVRDLDTCYTTSEPPTQLTWDALRMQHMQARAAKPGRIASLVLFRPRNRLSFRVSFILLALLALLVIAGTAYAALVPLLTQTLSSQQGTQQLLLDRQFKDLHIPKTLGGFTFTVEKAYADSNRIIVGMTTTKPQAHPYDDAHFLYSTMKTQDGQILPMMNEEGMLGKGTESSVYSFDASNIQGSFDELRVVMRLDTLSVLQLNSVSPDGASSTTPQEYTVNGSLTFYFSVPFHHGRILDTPQSETAGGRTITLEKAIVSPSETQVFIQGIDVKREEAFFIGTLSVEGHDYSVTDLSLGENNTLVLTFPYALAKKHGTWTLTFKQDPRVVKSSGVHVKGGPWVFHFIVP